MVLLSDFSANSYFLFSSPFSAVDRTQGWRQNLCWRKQIVYGSLPAIKSSF